MPVFSVARPAGRAISSWLLLGVFVLVLGQSALTAWVLLRDDAGDGHLVEVIDRSRPAVVTLLVERPSRVQESPRVAGAGASDDAGLRVGGSGFFVDPDGTLVTNSHTIAGVRRIVVRTADGTRYPAEVVGADPRTDIAVLKVTADTRFPSLAFADRGPHGVGRPVIAIGSPFGYEGSVTVGTVSAVERDYGRVDPVRYIQHDAAINKGNSGGPLLDGDGRVVGINTAIADEAPYHVGISLAIPSGFAARIVADLRRDGEVRRGYAGLTMQQVDTELAAALGLASADGVVVTDVQPDSPADRAGLAAGDLVVAASGRQVRDIRDINRVLLARAPGDRLALSVDRGDRRLQVRLTLSPAPERQVVAASGPGARPDRPGRSAAHRPRSGAGLDLGLMLAGEVVTRGSARPETQQPTRIADVDPQGLAAGNGLRSGDIIRAVGSRSVATVEAAREAFREATGPVALLIERPGQKSAYVVVQPDDGGRLGEWGKGNQGSLRAGPF